MKHSIFGFLAVMILGIACFFTLESANNTRKVETMPMSFRTAVCIARPTSAAPDTSSWLQIGDTNSRRAAVQLFPTDTAKVGVRKKFGTVILNSADTTLWIYNGQKWKKLN